MKNIVAVGCVLAVASGAVIAGSAQAVAPSTATARFVAGSGNYLLSKNNTDGIQRVGGWIRFTQASSGAAITVTGTVRGLRPNTRFVAVPYKDGICAPIVGITAFPSGSFRTNTNGVARIPAGVTVNPRAINPLGAINVSQTHSVSIRRVILAARPLPPVPGYPLGLPAGTPNVPNGAAVQACDRTPEVVG